MDIIGKRYIWFAFSGVLIFSGFLSFLIWGLPLSIDFTGGSLIEVSFDSGRLPPLEEVRQLYAELGYDEAVVQSAEGNEMIVRTPNISASENNVIVAKIETQFDTTITILRFESVGPTIGREIAVRAAGAIGLAAVGMLAYIWYVFRGIPNAYRYGVTALFAVIHDVAVVVGVQALLGRLLGWEVDSLFLTALLTIIGYSVLDSIVVFDRIRENARLHKRLSFEKLVNHSVVQTLDRSLNTQLTVLFPLLALAMFGGSTIQQFVIILLVGLMTGTYSSIFNAAPVLVVWENREWTGWFGRSKA